MQLLTAASVLLASAAGPAAALTTLGGKPAEQPAAKSWDALAADIFHAREKLVFARAGGPSSGARAEQPAAKARRTTAATFANVHAKKEKLASEQEGMLSGSAKQQGARAEQPAAKARSATEANFAKFHAKKEKLTSGQEGVLSGGAKQQGARAEQPGAKARSATAANFAKFHAKKDKLASGQEGVLSGGAKQQGERKEQPAEKALNVTAAKVAKLHLQMEKIAAGLDAVLSAGPNPLARSQVAPAVRAFLKELRATLAATAAPRDAPLAMRKLITVQAGVADLMHALTKQQESLMHEDATQEANLLMGVLTTRRKEPLETQLEVLRNPDFCDLAVSKALLAHHDGKTPLFQQAAAYIDAHGVSANVTAADQKARALAKTSAFFEKRVAKMEAEEQKMQKLQDSIVSKFDGLIKQNGTSKAEAHRYELLKRRSVHGYRRRLAAHQQQTKTMKDIVAALKRGDLVALKKGQETLRQYMQARIRESGNFLHLLQLGHRLVQQDCPYCVAQCIEKCHNGGKSYAVCMGGCADAGH